MAKPFELGLLLATLAFFHVGCGVERPAETASTLTAKEALGKAIFFDNLAEPDVQSCATCHGPDVGFTGPIPGDQRGGVVYEGAVAGRFGSRKPPSAAYATLSPPFHLDETVGEFVGGNFWDGRATGEHLGNPAADQAMGPFLNPVEQNNPDRRAVLEQILAAPYADLWLQAWGEPLGVATEEEVEMNYERVALAIAAYEGSSEVNAFSSKYDAYLRGEVELTPEELTGLGLFNSRGQCVVCHPSAPGPNGEPPLFTNYAFENLGLPRNTGNPFYEMDEVLLDDGRPINAAGDDWIDRGLAEFLETRSEWADRAAENLGKFRTPTLRNVDRRPTPDFPKVYMHNGVLTSLEEVVHFYNTRDVGAWPEPEVAVHVDTVHSGNLGLTSEEEAAIVAFLRTLSDGWEVGK